MFVFSKQTNERKREGTRGFLIEMVWSLPVRRAVETQKLDEWTDRGMCSLGTREIHHHHPALSFFFSE
jgi:hypothetical protein